MNTLLDAALAMARRGYRVFPLRPYGKKPAIDSFPVRATTDEGQLRAWWAENPQYNPGILTTDLVVVDVDTKKGDYAVNNYGLLGGHFNTFVVQTPTGGFHCYFDGPDSKLAVDLVPGVDIRSHNGYVVGPGAYVDPVLSQEPDIKSAGQYNIHCDEQVAWVPLDIERQLEAPGRRVREDFGIDLDTQTAIDNAAAWLAKMPPAIEGQGGDNHTYAMATKLVRDYALTPETAFLIMAGEWNMRCLPPWQPDELYRKIDNAAQYGQSALGAARVENNFGVGQVVVPATPQQQTARERGVYMGNLLDPNAIPARPWLVERLLLRGDVTVLAAPGAGGKSAFKLAVAAHWAVGKDFGPYKLKDKGVPIRVFAYNAEDDITEQSRRVLAICRAFNLDYEAVRQNLCCMDDSQGELVLCTSVNRSLGLNADIMQYVIDTAKEYKADVLMFDPLVNLHSCNENDNGEMRFVISTLRRIGREVNAAVFVAHHVSKGAGGHKGDAEGIRGAGSIINSARVAVMLSGASQEDRTEYGIQDHEKYAFVRLDDAKANMFMRADNAIMWMRWQTIGIPSGDLIGVAMPVDIDTKKKAEAEWIIRLTHEAIIRAGRAAVTRADIMRQLLAADPLYEQIPESTLRNKIDKAFARPVEFAGDRMFSKTVGTTVHITLET